MKIPKEITVHADKRTSAAYLVYDKHGNFISDEASDELAQAIQESFNGCLRAVGRCVILSDKNEKLNDQVRREYINGEQDAAERLAVMFEHYGHERAAKDIREEAEMEKFIYIFSDNENLATDENGFLHKFNKTRKKWLPLKPLKHPGSDRVYFVTTINGVNYEHNQEQLKEIYRRSFYERVIVIKA